MIYSKGSTIYSCLIEEIKEYDRSKYFLSFHMNQMIVNRIVHLLLRTVSCKLYAKSWQHTQILENKKFKKKSDVCIWGFYLAKYKPRFIICDVEELILIVGPMLELGYLSFKQMSTRKHM